MLVLPKKHILTLPFFRQRNLYYEFTFTCKIHIDTQHSHTTQYTTTTKNQNSIISLTLLICFLLIPFSFREFLTYRNHHKALCQIIPINSSLENTFLTKLPHITKFHDPPLILSFFFSFSQKMGLRTSPYASHMSFTFADSAYLYLFKIIIFFFPSLVFFESFCKRERERREG